jgi:hypothetical protein
MQALWRDWKGLPGSTRGDFEVNSVKPGALLRRLKFISKRWLSFQGFQALGLGDFCDLLALKRYLEQHAVGATRHRRLFFSGHSHGWEAP